MNNITMDLTKKRIYIAGHQGMVGSAITRKLEEQGCRNILTRTHNELDLTSQHEVRHFFEEEQPDVVIIAAAKVGGIVANDTFPADFIYQNLMIENNVIHQAHKVGVQHLLFLGSSCIYPKYAPQPMKEECLLTGLLEPTNEPYAIAKIAGIKLCEAYNRQHGRAYYSVMPTNLYGIGDNYDLTTSHVLPAMIRKFHLAKLAQQKKLEEIIADESYYGTIPYDIATAIGYAPSKKLEKKSPQVILWGTGSPRREFLYVDDMATASIYLLGLPREKFLAPNPSFFNIGTGKDCSIQEIALLIAEIIGFDGEIIFDNSKPDGTPQKLLDISRLQEQGWSPLVSLHEGISLTFQNYLHKKQVKL